jgi:hypothetical protein
MPTPSKRRAAQQWNLNDSRIKNYRETYEPPKKGTAKVIDDAEKQSKSNQEFIRKSGVDKVMQIRNDIIKSGKASILPSMKKKK